MTSETRLGADARKAREHRSRRRTRLRKAIAAAIVGAVALGGGISGVTAAYAAVPAGADALNAPSYAAPNSTVQNPDGTWSSWSMWSKTNAPDRMLGLESETTTTTAYQPYNLTDGNVAGVTSASGFQIPRGAQVDASTTLTNGGTRTLSVTLSSAQTATLTSSQSGPVTLAPGQSFTYTWRSDVMPAVWTPGAPGMQVTVTSPSDPAAGTVTMAPQNFGGLYFYEQLSDLSQHLKLSFTKLVNGVPADSAAAAHVAAAGSPVTFTYVLTNNSPTNPAYTGTQPNGYGIRVMSLTDASADAASWAVSRTNNPTPPTMGAGQTVLAPGQTITWTATGTMPASLTETKAELSYFIYSIYPYQNAGDPTWHMLNAGTRPNVTTYLPGFSFGGNTPAAPAGFDPLGTYTLSPVQIAQRLNAGSRTGGVTSNATSGAQPAPAPALLDASAFLRAPVAPAVDTVAAPSQAAPGDQLTDTVNVTGDVPAGASVRASLYKQPAGSASAVCTSSELVGTTGDVTAAAAGQYTVGPLTVSAPGTYFWLAELVDSTGAVIAADACGSATEQVTVTQTVTPLAPTVAVSTVCDVEGVVSTPTTTGIDYAQTRVGNTVTVTATAQTGYAIAAGATTSWTFDVTPATKCATPIAPTVAAATDCNIPGSVVIPTAEGVVYLETPQGNTVTVTAVATEGYGFAPGTTTEWTLDIGPADGCITVTTQAQESSTVGGPAHDVATVTGDVPAGAYLTFEVYTWDGQDARPAQPLALVDQKMPVSGAGDYTSSAYTFTGVGQFQWFATLHAEDGTVLSSDTWGIAAERTTVTAAAEVPGETPTPSAGSSASSTDASIARTDGAISALPIAGGIILLGSAMLIGVIARRRRHERS